MKTPSGKGLAVLMALACLVVAHPAGEAVACVVPDDGSGTVSLPPEGCAYLSPDEVHMIIDGLPAGTEILLDTIHIDFICKQGPNPEHCGNPGGSLGGEVEFFGSNLQLNITGTGDLAGFQRNIVLSAFCETHTGPRNPGDPVQSFPNEMVSLQGSLFGDPDFDQLTIVAGTGFGLPSPGQTTLTRLGPPGSDFQVDSFFDVSYRIDFQGAAGSVLGGLSGSTTGTIRMEAAGATCEPTLDGAACQPSTCPTPGEDCAPKCVNYDPLTGQITVIACECRGPNECHVDLGTGAAAGGAAACVVPDDGGGTVTLPPIGCEYLSPEEFHMIVDGLPVGTTIEMAPIHKDFICKRQTGFPDCPPPGLCEEPGGGLGGNVDCFGSNLVVNMTGTGDLAGFSRSIGIPVNCQIHTGPRLPGLPTQTIPTDMFFLEGEIFGDPDFDLLRVTGGTGFGLPSPGQTTLTQLPSGNFVVDSFFDITYQIEFQGAPGSVLEGKSGITTATIHMQTGAPPSCTGGCPAGEVCEETQVVNADGTIDICCSCVPAQTCQPSSDGTACEPVACPVPTEICTPRCVEYDPLTGQTTVVACECRDPDECHVDMGPGAAAGGAAACTVPDDGGGTVTLPPLGCEYLSPEEFHMIVDGLPVGTTIEMAPIHKDFICKRQTGFPDCPPVGLCEEPGGGLGGNVDCFGSTLELNMTGTGDLTGFNRLITIPVGCQVHTGPRLPGLPTQTIPTDMFFLEGEIFGDPDFDLLRVTGGTGFGLPSPGQTTLTQLPSGNFVVDSFFDITYQIEFQGAPGSVLEGKSGITTATIHMQTGAPPSCIGGCPVGEVCEETQVITPDGTIRICCDCVPAQTCQPSTGGLACDPVACAVSTEICLPRCVHYDPVTCQTTVVDCECRGPNLCRVDFDPAGSDCVQPDNGNGTVDLPPFGCDYVSPDDVHRIINGLPAGTTIELDAVHKDFINVVRVPGGTLGGEVENFDSQLELQITGTGGLAGFNRFIVLPVATEVHTAPRTAGDPVQCIATDMFKLDGQIFGDPDFDLLRITGGTSFGMPSPGQTTLTRLGPAGSNFAVCSFFNVSYRIEYVGAPGSVLDGFSGTSAGTILMETGSGCGGQPSACVGPCPPGFECVRTVVVNPDGTEDICCDCEPDPQICRPTDDQSDCVPTVCPDPNEECVAHCVRTDPLTGLTTVIDCECRGPTDCQVDFVPGAAAAGNRAPNPCVIPDDAGGTVTLPPAGCEYLSPEEVHVILDGLPAGTTIELEAIHRDFICKQGPAGHFPGCPPPGLCEEPGGSLGGNVDCFMSDLLLTVTGTGGLNINRTIAVQAMCRVDTAPRTSGDPLQEFDTEMFALQGELFGDPDFCSLRIFAGSLFGLPSPGHTKLVRQPSGSFAVDSFFDITYKIEFEGCPGSVLDGLSGSTVGTIRMQTGVPIPPCVGGCPPGQDCVRTVLPNADGTVDTCCDCEPLDCDCPGDINGDSVLDGLDIAAFVRCLLGIPNANDNCACADLDGDGDADVDDIPLFVNRILFKSPCACEPTPDGAECKPVACPVPGQECEPTCITVNFETGMNIVTVGDCQCRDPDECHAEVGTGDPFCVGGCPSGFECVRTDVFIPNVSIQTCCTCEPIGACCLPNGPCVQMAEANCLSQGGTYFGDGTPCGGIEACCAQDPTGGGTQCFEVDALCCSAIFGGVPQGPGSTCQPAGACCYDADGDGVAESCDVMAEACCDDLLGTFLGPNTVCQGDANGNGIDDACEQALLCQLPPTPPTPLCIAFQPQDCQTTNPATETCLPKVYQANPGAPPQLVNCGCFQPGGCGTIELNGTTLFCPGDCPGPAVETCEIHVNGQATGANSVDAGTLPVGSIVTCECAPQ